MAVEAVSYEEAKQLTLDYYTKIRDSLPLPMRDMPRKVVENKSLSINSIIAHITSNTDIGQWLIAEYIESMGMVVSG